MGDLPPCGDSDCNQDRERKMVVIGPAPGRTINDAMHTNMTWNEDLEGGGPTHWRIRAEDKENK